MNVTHDAIVVRTKWYKCPAICVINWASAATTLNDQWLCYYSPLSVVYRTSKTFGHCFQNTASCLSRGITNDCKASADDESSVASLARSLFVKRNSFLERCLFGSQERAFCVNDLYIFN